MNGRNTALILFIIVFIAGGLVWKYRNAPFLAPLLGSNSAPATQHEVNRVNYVCDASKTIVATYFEGPASTASVTADAPPTPTGSVTLTLSDNRSLTLPQTISGSGTRYANADESMVFWSKGNTSFITEGTNQTQTFANCVVASNISGQESWSTYATTSAGYSVRYPKDFTLNTAYVNTTLGPGKSIKGIQMVIPATMATGTNLSTDSGISVEQLPGVTECSATLFLDSTVSTSTLSDNGVDYSVAKGSGAGAGNLYNETVYALPNSSPCTAVRYFIHTTQLGNYPAGTVKAYDQTSLNSAFDGIRMSLLLAR